jgi:hypothetical protein
MGKKIFAKKKFTNIFLKEANSSKHPAMPETAGSKRKGAPVSEPMAEVCAPVSDPMAEVRAALREAERAEWIGNCFEIKYLQGQAEHLRCIPAVSKHAELALITQQLKQKAARDRQKAAGTANKLGTFTCPICMDAKPLANLRLNYPCGHGFCLVCIEKYMRGQNPSSACPNCRQPIDSVVQTYV